MANGTECALYVRAKMLRITDLNGKINKFIRNNINNNYVKEHQTHAHGESRAATIARPKKKKKWKNTKTNTKMQHRNNTHFVYNG